MNVCCCFFFLFFLCVFGCQCNQMVLLYLITRIIGFHFKPIVFWLHFEFMQFILAFLFFILYWMRQQNSLFGVKWKKTLIRRQSIQVSTKQTIKTKRRIKNKNKWKKKRFNVISYFELNRPWMKKKKQEIEIIISFNITWKVERLLHFLNIESFCFSFSSSILIFFDPNMIRCVYSNIVHLFLS